MSKSLFSFETKVKVLSALILTFFSSIDFKLSEKHGVNPIRTASLLDTMSCAVQGIIPYGAQILIATSLAASIGGSSFTILKGMFYPLLMGFGLLFSVLRTKEKKEDKNLH